MSRTRYKVYDSDHPYFITCNVVNRYPLFSYPFAAEIALNAFEFIKDKRGGKLVAYVIMENHVHFIIQAPRLRQVLRAFKSWTARQIIDGLVDSGHSYLLFQLKHAKSLSNFSSTHQVWREGYHAKLIMDDEMMAQKVDYIHNNPVRRGFVDRPEDWRYSSARNYLGLEGLISINWPW